MKRIKDTFSDLPISRQQRYRLRQRAKGRCGLCGRGAAGLSRCRLCAKAEHYQKGGKRFNSTSKRIRATAERKAKKAAAKQVNPWLPPELRDKV